MSIVRTPLGPISQVPSRGRTGTAGSAARWAAIAPISSRVSDSLTNCPTYRSGVTGVGTGRVASKAARSAPQAKGGIVVVVVDTGVVVVVASWAHVPVGPHASKVL